MSTVDSLTFDSTPPEQTLLRYFAALNEGDFQATASLFAPDGVLHPPFDAPLSGREAIARYLTQEANGLQLQPLKKTSEPIESEGNHCKYDILGSVQTTLFTVNVCWTFVLNHQAEIASVSVKLLATIKELLNMKQ